MAKMKRSYSDLQEQRLEQYSTQLSHSYKHAQNSSSPRLKACLQCGTTRTPQWREGPLGPKTLCNACGVKRVRQLKAIQEGRKPMPSSMKRQPVVYTPFQAPARTESTEVATVLQMLAHEPLQLPPAEPRRPLRQSAIRAIQRAAECHYDNPISTRPKGSIGNESNMPTDSGEEISWSPRDSPVPVKQQADVKPEDMEALEADAAANLLSMSCAPPPALSAVPELPPRSSPLLKGSSGSPAPKRSKLQQTAPPHLQYPSPRRAGVAAAAVAAPRPLAEESMAYLLGPGLSLLADMLPEQDLERLLVLRDEVEDTHREATAADAAVAAVAKILELKEAAASRARSMALAAARQLHDFMNLLNSEHQLGQRLAGQAAHPPAALSGPAAVAAPQKHHHAGAAAGGAAGAAGSPGRLRGLHLHPVPFQEKQQQQQHLLQHIHEAVAVQGPSRGLPPRASPPAAPPPGSNSSSMVLGGKSQGPSSAEASQGAAS